MYRASFLLIAITALAGTSRAEPPPAMASTKPSRGSIVRYVTLPGTLLPDQQATLFAKVGGYLGQATVDKGAKVQKGQLLAEIDVPELEAEWKKNQAETRLAEIELQRLRGASGKAPDLVTPLAVDKAEAAFAMSQAQAEKTAALLKYSKILAPFDGVVTERFLDPGAFVPAAATGSNPQNAALFTLMNFDVIRAQTAIPEVDASFVKTGQPVKITVEGAPGKTFEGTVSRFSQAVDSDTRSMIVQADLPNPDLVLRPGMYAKVSLGVQEHMEALLVPKPAIVMEKTNSFVFRFLDGKARKTPVKIGFDDGQNIEVLEGLEGGEILLVPGKITLTDGQAVQTMEKLP